MKRVLCLYRVSTKQQVNAEDDIPMQRRECKAFIAQHPDWVFLYERLEKGVSGYKLSVSKRDVLQDIKRMAEQKLFDVLLVFMFDRLGRREDETPFLVEWFVDHNIEVWSTREGQTRLDNRGDKLINYIRYWQAGGESEKTSERVRAAHTQMTEDGIWRGGRKPFGYRLVRKGRINKKGYPLWDPEIDPDESEIVKTIFKMYCEDGYGTQIIANYLNDIGAGGRQWIPQSVRGILKNITYTGRLHMGDTLSEPNEELRIISDRDFNYAQYLLKAHIQLKHPDLRQAELDALPFEFASKTAAYGATMLKGILYCGCCGSRLTGTYVGKERKGGTYHRPVYRCYNAASKHGCEGQVTYSAKILESKVCAYMNAYLRELRDGVDPSWREKAKRNLASRQREELSSLENEYRDLIDQEEMLEAETIKSLHGESHYDVDTLSKLILKNREAIERNLSEHNRIATEMNSDERRLRALSDQYRYALDWTDRFENAPDSMKKTILARFVKRITIFKGNEITIQFHITYPDFNAQVDSYNAIEP